MPPQTLLDPPVNPAGRAAAEPRDAQGGGGARGVPGVQGRRLVVQGRPANHPPQDGVLRGRRRRHRRPQQRSFHPRRCRRPRPWCVTASTDGGFQPDPNEVSHQILIMCVTPSGVSHFTDPRSTGRRAAGLRSRNQRSSQDRPGRCTGRTGGFRHHGHGRAAARPRQRRRRGVRSQPPQRDPELLRARR